MQVTDSFSAATRAERAYFFYLQRQRRGLSGNEHGDWLRAEASFQQNDLPLTAIKGIGPRAAAELSKLGINGVRDLATWQLSDFGERLPRLTARARSGQWIEQARGLS